MVEMKQTETDVWYVRSLAGITWASVCVGLCENSRSSLS